MSNTANFFRLTAVDVINTKYIIWSEVFVDLDDVSKVRIYLDDASENILTLRLEDLTPAAREVFGPVEGQEKES